MMSNQFLQVLRFQVQNIHLCIEIKYINKVLPLVEMEAIPKSPPYLIGLINLGGHSIPVLDLAIRLKIKRVEKYNLDTPILLCTNQHSRQVGLIVDKILGLTHINIKELQECDEFDNPNSFFLASVNREDELSLLINTEKVIDIHFITNKDNQVGQKNDTR